MSLIRNARGEGDRTLTAKRFVAGQPIPVGGSSYRPIEYIQVQKGYFFLSTRKELNINRSTSLVVRCEFESGASGYLFGTSTGLQILKEESNIKWKYNTTELYSTPWAEGMHDYGFLSTQEGMKPFYDGNVITPTQPITSVAVASMAIGIATSAGKGSDVTGDPIEGTSWGLRVREIMGTPLYSYGGVEKNILCHWYSTLTTNNSVLYETRADNNNTLNMGAILASDGEKVNGGAITFGMQQSDLKELFGSPYYDLIMTLTSDGGIDTDGGWKPYSEQSYPNNRDWPVSPATFTVDNKQHKLAFHIPSSRIVGQPVVTAPTYPDDSGQGSWDVGELYYGRKPRWNIWNDNVKAFKYIRRIPVYSGNILQYYKNQLAYNIFKDVYGRDMTQYSDDDINRGDQIEAFDGYNNHSNGKHLPAITIPSTSVKMYYYGDYNFEKASNKIYDNYVYAYDRQSPTQNITVKLGNLPWWNLTKDEQDALVTEIGHTLRVFGVHVALQHYASTGGGWVTLGGFVALSTAKDGNDQWIPFCKENLELGSNGDAPAFRDNGVQATLNFGDNGPFFRFEDEDRTRVVISLAMAHKTDLNVDRETIDCSHITPGKMVKTSVVRYEEDIRLVGSFTNDGTVKLGLVDNNLSRHVYLRDYNTGEYRYIRVYTNYNQDENLRYALGAQFAIKGDNDSEAVDLFQKNGTAYVRDSNGFIKSNYLVYVTCTYINNFSMLIGAEPTDVYVGEYPFTGYVHKHMLDSPTGKIYHRSGNSIVEDANVTCGDISEITNPNVYTTYWAHYGDVPYRWGEDEQWHRLPDWYSQGCMLAKYSGWAQPFHNNDGRLRFISQGPSGGSMPWETTSLICPNGDAQGTYKTLSIEWKRYWPNQQLVTNGSDKVADAIIYPMHMALGNPVDIYTAAPPSVVRYRFFEKATAPHTCGPYMSSGSYQISQGNTLYWYVDFLDKCENYAFHLNSNKNGYKYVVVGDDPELAYNYTAVVDVWLRLYNGNNVDKTTDEEYESHKFKLSLFKQTPCTPYNTVAGTGSEYETQEYDDTWRLTPIFIGQTMPSIGSSQTVTKDGVTYTIRMFSAQTHNGVYPELAGQNKKYMVSNPTCFNLGVTASTTPEPGTKYIYVISPA